MRLIVDGKAYDYDESRLLNTEAIALQKATGMSVRQFGDALKEADPVALTAVVWLAMRRAGENVRFDDLVFDLGSIEIEEEPEPEPARPTQAAKTSRRGG